jgi:hypothetical protein
MPATEAVTASGMAPDGGVRIARAIGEALRLLDRVRNRALQGEDVIPTPDDIDPSRPGAIPVFSEPWPSERRSVSSRVGITRLREAFSCLAEAEQRVQEGAIDDITWRYVGEAVLLANQVGRSPLL